MNYSDLFNKCKSQLKEQIKNIWLEDKNLWTKGKTLKDYENNLDLFLEDCVNADNLLVEDMGEWETTQFPSQLIDQKYWREWANKEKSSLAKAVATLTPKNYSPFYHQVESWEKLLNGKSICVTSGTGSGKTECFMVPLVKDLADDYKKRHSKNPQGPEPVQAIFLYPLNALMDDQRTRMSECIECCEQDLKFAVYNGNTPENIDDDIRNANTVNDDRRKHEVVFRDDIRASQHPNILFTNPTMLEYLLLRKKDDDILKHSKGQLRWIVIDETHTYTGAGAAELALLIRRVLDAFDTPLDNVRFATSSATVGDASVINQLKEFIANITGKNKKEIEVITGSRQLQVINNTQYTSLQNHFLTLNEMFPKLPDFESQLGELDKLCSNGLKVKVHLFVKALNRGLFIELGRNNNFGLIDTIPIDSQTHSFDKHVLEARYCSDCGCVFAYGEIKGNKLCRGIIETSSIFDDDDVNDSLDDNEEDSDSSASNPNTKGDTTPVLITRSDFAHSIGDFISSSHIGDGVTFDLTNDMEIIDKGTTYIRWEDEDGFCPICGMNNTIPVLHTIRKFNIASDKIARIVAPTLLEQAQGVNQTPIMFEGKQMIAFADSRNKAARPTLKQNLESERKWVEWVIYNELINRQNKGDNTPVSWSEAMDLLLDNEYCDFFAKQFASNDDLDDLDEFKNKYVLAALYEVFKRRGRKAQTAETNGYIKVVYPDLDKIIQLPASVNQLNSDPDCKKTITDKDWLDLLTLYLDHNIRNNECLYFLIKSTDWKYIDISVCRRLRSTNGSRRTAKYDKGTLRFKQLVSNVFEEDYNQLDHSKKGLVDDVVKSIWTTLRDDLNIIDRGQFIGENNRWTDDSLLDDYEENEQGRLNVKEIGFSLPTNVWICPVTNRYLTTTFHDYSPYKKYGIYNQKASPCTIGTMPEPKLFIQSEHTAQLGRNITKSRIIDFKEHKINILSCSTTMEMGVDLGSVELVEMTNVPPMPSNYKQRAGRAGRRGQNRSACLTICGSDGVDSAFFHNSKQNVTKSILPPVVDLKSPQVIQRHINSYLFKQWCNTINLDSEVMSLFSNYHWRIDTTKNKPDKTVAQYRQNNIDVQVTPNGTTGTIPYQTVQTALAPWSSFVSFLQTLHLNTPQTNDDINIRNGITNIIRESVYSGGDLDDYVFQTATAIEKIWREEIDSYFLSLKALWDQATTNNPKGAYAKLSKALNYDFTSRLQEPLLIFLSNHQFLPNANMPINIVELKVNNGVNEDYKIRNSDNPTYDLAIALTQWSPGNYVTIKDTTYQIGGIQRDYSKSYKRIKKCNDCGHTWITPETSCPVCKHSNLKRWTVNGETDLKLLEPIAFIPSSDVSRITDNTKKVIRTKAELIGASQIHRPSKGWFSHRISNSNNTTSQILLYNDGIGFGYRICKKCGKTELETASAGSLPMNDTIDTFFEFESQKKPNLRYHNSLNSDKQCFIDIQKESFDDKVFRNIIIGGFIQTDYCEIGLYRSNGLQLEPFSNNSDGDMKIVTTLGILLCDFMVDEGICERNDIDFISTDMGTLCIYDKAKGGAGYSRQLNQNKLEKALDYCKNKLRSCTSLFSLLDTYSQLYADQIDIDSTLTWLEDEYNNRNAIPNNVKTAYSNAVFSSFLEIKQLL